MKLFMEQGQRASFEQARLAGLPWGSVDFFDWGSPAVGGTVCAIKKLLLNISFYNILNYYNILKLIVYNNIV